MLGSRIYTDEYGTPYIRRRWALEDDERSPFFTVANPNDLAAGVIEYLPRWPADPSWSSWPAEWRAVVPEEWSGDMTRGGWASAYQGDAAAGAYVPLDQQVWSLSRSPATPFYAYAEGTGIVMLRALYANLRVCGWGRWVGARSSITGARGECVSRTGLDFTNLDRDIADHFRAVGGKMGMVLRALAKLVSFVPGVGTVVAAVLAGIGSLAAGEPLDAAFLDAAINAIPGGGIAKDAAQLGASTAKKLIEGGTIGEAALEGVRQVLVQNGVPAAALTAFDMGVALGTGQGLQRAGFRVLNLFVPGDDLLERGLAYTKVLERATALGQPIQDVLKRSLAGELSRIENAAAQLGPVLEAIDRNPAKLAMGSRELAEEENVPEPVARAAQAVMREGVADEELRRELTMTTTERLFEKYDARDVVAIVPGVTEQRANDRIRRAVVADDSLTYAAQKAAQDAALRQAATADYRTSFVYQYQQATGRDLAAEKEIARRAADASAPPAVTATAAPRSGSSRSTVAQDIGLGVTVAAALGALYLWARD